jgi:protein-S-isoprenylcysteine O-methyltransferase Ste14
VLGLLESFARFALQGLGTPAPVFPTRRLVVTGVYRYVRNPMYVAVAAIILGQALLFGSVALLEYGAVVWLMFHLFVLLYEEPTLRGVFGSDYEAFRAAVPRWIPRLTPWRGPDG